MEEIKVTIHEDIPSPRQKNKTPEHTPRLTPITRQNLIKLLSKKKQSLSIVAECHEYMQSVFHILDVGIYALMITMVATSFVASLVYEPAVSFFTGIATALIALKRYMQPAETAKSHEADFRTAADLCDDIEYLLLKNTHNDDNLKHIVDVYDERIRSFRKHETRIPIHIKKRFIKQYKQRHSTLAMTTSVSRI